MFSTLSRAAKSYATMGNKFDKNVLTPFANKSLRKMGNAVKGMPAGFNELAITGALSAFIGSQTFDPTIHDSKLTHIGKEAVGMSIDNLAFMINPMLGMGMIGANLLGVPTIGQMATDGLNILEQHSRKLKQGKPRTQTETTKRATSANLAMLSHGGSHASLGREALITHN